jgi:RNA polymerase primary sigma factor
MQTDDNIKTRNKRKKFYEKFGIGYANQELFFEALCKALPALPVREQEVLKMRLGLDNGHFLTLEEVGLCFNVTRERIRHIEAKALRHIWYLKMRQTLKDYPE